MSPDRTNALEVEPSLSLARVLESRKWPENHPAIWMATKVTSWDQFAQLYQQALSQLDSCSGRLGLVMEPADVAMGMLAAAERRGRDLFLLDGQWSAEQLAQVQQEWNLSHVLSVEGIVSHSVAEDKAWSKFEKHSEKKESPTGTVTILTSGTTGKMKAVCHTWNRLIRPVRCTGEDGMRQHWLLAYRPHLYAGLQVALQALINGGTLVVPRPHDDPTEVARLMAEAEVGFASATPSYWRRLLLWADPTWTSRIALQQITLGGEAIDQEILDRLHDTFPTARIVHIYATTELGRCFAVSDGRAGFPQRYLDAPTPEGVELQIRDQQLWVRSTNAMSGYDNHASDMSLPQSDADGWFPTSDLVRVEGDRVYFAGRMSDMINVGGNKVYPLIVERAIRQVAGVADVRVYAQTSSVAGQLVACQLVAQKEVDPEELRTRVLTHCRQTLDRYQCPRVVELVDRLKLTAAGKLAR